MAHVGCHLSAAYEARVVLPATSRDYYIPNPNGIRESFSYFENLGALKKNILKNNFFF